MAHCSRLLSDLTEYLDQGMFRIYQLLLKQQKMEKWNSLLGEQIKLSIDCMWLSLRRQAMISVVLFLVMARTWLTSRMLIMLFMAIFWQRRHLAKGHLTAERCVWFDHPVYACGGVSFCYSHTISQTMLLFRSGPIYLKWWKASATHLPPSISRITSSSSLPWYYSCVSGYSIHSLPSLPPSHPCEYDFTITIAVRMPREILAMLLLCRMRREWRELLMPLHILGRVETLLDNIITLSGNLFIALF